MRVNAQKILDYISGNDIPEEELERLNDESHYFDYQIFVEAK